MILDTSRAPINKWCVVLSLSYNQFLYNSSPSLISIDIEKHEIYVLQITLPKDCRENENVFAGFFICLSRLLRISLYPLLGILVPSQNHTPVAQGTSEELPNNPAGRKVFADQELANWP